MPEFSELANALRFLSIDAVEKANSGHPGAPMGMADMAAVLWRQYLKHHPKNPKWFNRDRFVLSNGHASMLLYSLLHLTGYDLSIEDLKAFRKLHSKTPGHPEYGITEGIETTTGPLGQGLANAVGMALAEKILAAQFNRPGFEIVDHHTYVFLGDGCLMEGISHEVCSLAGTLKLGKLICFYDANGISIDGDIQGWFTDDTAKRFEAYGWQVIPQVDGHSEAEIQAAIEMARTITDAPTLIICKTVIGCGSPKYQGTHDVHGKPLGQSEIEATRAHLGWKYPPFEIPEAIYQQWDAKEKGQQQEEIWQSLLARYQAAHPELASEFIRRTEQKLPENWKDWCDSSLIAVQASQKKMATRKASESCLNRLATMLPELLGGSADLTGSNNTFHKLSKPIQTTFDGNYIFFGVREFGMTALLTGVALHTGLIPYSGTFLVFMEYARNAVRMAAIMSQRNILVYTHDSIGLGEDGPTHQPIEQLASLRMTPNVEVWRPADEVETFVAWQCAIERQHGPSALILSRQDLPPVGRTAEQLSLVYAGGYIVTESAHALQVVLIATGSELQLALSAKVELEACGIGVRVVSMCCLERFLQQDVTYQQSVLPEGVYRLAVEASIQYDWLRVVGLTGDVIGMRSFGESGPASDLYKHFGITVDKVVETVKRKL